MSETFGALLREHRISAGLNQSELAYLADCDQTYVGLLERDAREPSRRAVLALVLALDLTTSQTDRLLFAGGHRPLTDYQALYEADHGALSDRTKWCRRCHQALSVKRFSIDRSRPDALAPHCKACESARQHTLRLRRLQRSA